VDQPCLEHGGPRVSGPPALTAFLGLSHLGIVTALGWSAHDLPSLGIDPDPGLVAKLNRGELPLSEPGLLELFEQTREMVSFTDDLTELSECAVVIVSLDVPTDADNVSDVEAIKRLIESALPHVRQDVALVVLSQVPPGFTRSLHESIRRIRPDLTFELFYWVETLIFGDAVNRTLHPERFIVGCSDSRQQLPPALEVALRCYACPVLTMSYESAELTKTAINLYLVGAVTYANTMADLCEAIGADWAEMVPALKLDQRIGKAAYLRPGLGVAGGNLERDLMTLRALCRSGDVDATYLDALIDYNTKRFAWVIQKLERWVFTCSSYPTVAIWGLAYKKNTNSTKNSTAVRLIGELQGRASMRAWDPLVPAAADIGTIEFAESLAAAVRGADCLVIMTDCDEFVNADINRIRTELSRPVVIDAVGVLEGRRHELAGIEYISMGRGV